MGAEFRQAVDVETHPIGVGTLEGFVPVPDLGLELNYPT